MNKDIRICFDPIHKPYRIGYGVCTYFQLYIAKTIEKDAYSVFVIWD